MTLANWRATVPKGAKCKKRDWVHYTNGSFIAGAVDGWGEEDLYFMATVRGEQPLMMAMTLDEAAAICGVLSTTIMTVLWDRAKKEYEGGE